MAFKIKNLIWDLMAFFYDNFYNNFPPYQDLITNIINNLTNEDKNPIYLLDAGCGTGILSFKLAKIKNNFVVIGIDKSFSMLKQAYRKNKKEKLKNLFFIHRDLNKEIDFIKNDINKLFLIHSLYLLEQPGIFLRNINHLISEKGEIYICNPKRGIRTKELLSAGKLFLMEIGKKKGFLQIYYFAAITILMGFLNLLIQFNKKKKVFYCWNKEEIFNLLINSGFKIKWAKDSCLGQSHLLICAVKE